MAPWIIALCALGPVSSFGAEPIPFDEVTLDRIQEINQSISKHYEDLQSASADIAARRKGTQSRLTTIQDEIGRLEVEARVVRETNGTRGELGSLEENRLEAKSRYLEALAEQHAIDVEATKAFETHATAILDNLEQLAGELKKSPAARARTEATPADKIALSSLQRGTAIALTALEQWGALNREDPRFRSLWATARVLNRESSTPRSESFAQGIEQTVDLVQQRIFVVRSLVDQVRALQPALDQKGLLLQVAAQNQMLQLYSNNLGLVDGLEVPDLELEKSMQRIISDIEEGPETVHRDPARDPLEGLDDCAQRGMCR
jgi:TolA-binding protein